MYRLALLLIRKTLLRKQMEGKQGGSKSQMVNMLGFVLLQLPSLLLYGAAKNDTYTDLISDSCLLHWELNPGPCYQPASSALSVLFSFLGINCPNWA